MSIYDLPVATATRPGRLRGRSIYDNAGYAAPPIGLGNLPSLAAPTMRVAGGAASIYDTPNLPPMQPVPGADQAGPAAMGPPVDPDDPSLFAQARDVGLGGLSMLGNLLDTPGSMVRDALTWFPGGIAARNPLDQLLSPLSDQNRTTGEELLRLDEWQPDSWYGSVGKFGAGMAAEIALDPLTYMTLGGTALTKTGGQLASRAGMMGDAANVANRKLAAQAAKAGTDAVTVGAREARQLVNPRELAANLDEASRRKFRDGTTGDILDDAVETVAHTDGHPIGVEELVRSYNGMNARAIKAGEMPAASLSDDMIDAFRTGTASTDDLLAQSNIPADYLDEAIGGNFRFKVPFANKPINIPFTDRAIPDEFVFNDLRLPIPGKARELGGLGARAIGDLPIPKTDKRIQDLIPDFARDLPGMAADGRIEGRTIARAMDKTADAVMNNRPMLMVSSMFDRVGREAKHKLSRAAARESAQRGEEMARVVREEAAGPMADADKKMQAYSRTEGVTQQDVLDTQFDILDRMEGALTDDQLSPVAAQFQPAMDFFTNAFRTQADQAEAFGQNQQRLREGISYKVPKVNPDGTEVLGKDGKPEIEKVVLQSPIEYVPRNRQNESGVMRRVGNAMSKSGRMIQPDGFTKGRDEAMRHLRTSQIQRMSLDKKFAGRADRGVLGGKRSRELAAGNTGQFPDTGVMGSSLLERDTPEWEQAYSAFKKAYPPAKDYMRLAERGELKDINGNLVEWSPALDEALDDKHRQLFSKITQLDRAQVERGVPMFDTNVFQAGLNRLESGYQSAAQELGTRKLLSTSARLAKPRPVAEQSAAPTSKLASTSGRNIDSMNLFGENGENLERLGLNHDRGKQKLLGELAEQGHDIDGMAESIMAPKRDKIATELTELIARNSDTPIADLQGPIREALDNDPDSLLAAITTDEAMQERIGKLVDKYTNVEAKPDDILKKFEIDADLGNDMMAVNTRFSTPEEINAFTEALDAFTNMFKTNVTAAFPSFHTRNLFSAMMQNALNGVTDTSATRLRDRFFKPYSDARKVINGEVLADANQLPGMEKLSPEEATEKFRDEIFAQKIIDATGDHNDIPGLPSGGAIDARPGQSRGRAANLPESKGWDLVEKIPFARNFARNVREASLPPKKTRWRDTFNPLESSAVRGTREGTVKYGGERIGRVLGNEIESTVRIAPYIAFRRQGFTASEAAKKVKSLQVDYNDLTRTERKVMRRAAPFYCVPIEAEMLTRSGWKRYEELTVGESVGQYDIDTDTWTYAPLLAKQDFEFEGELHTTTTKNGVFASTMNHRWPVETRVRKSVMVGGKRTQSEICRKKEWRTSETLVDDSYLIAAAPHVSSERSSMSANDAAILGWLVTGGYMRLRRSNPLLAINEQHWEGRIYQHPKKFLQDVLRLLPNSVPCKPHPESGVVAVNVPAGDMRRILQFIDFDVANLPALTGVLSAEAADAMRIAMFQAEGHETSGRSRDVQHFAQDPNINPYVLDAFQILSLRHGRAANLSQRGAYIRKRQRYKAGKKSYGTMKYQGTVWCPTVSTGAWIMRQDGNVVVTGNSFNKGATKYLAGELSTRPGGPVAMTIKAAENASGNDPGTPEYIRDGLNIPLGGAAEDGSRNYLTGAGLMHEPPAQLLGNNIQETFYNAASMAHPIPKALIEYITDESLFLRDGKGGGRDLDDLDPPVGGTLRNIGQFTGLLDKERRSPIDLPIPFEKEFELAVANSPAARYLSQIRKSTDNRKNPLEKLLNGLTGFNVATVEPNERDAVLREQLEQLLRDMGGRTFSQAYMPDTTLAEMGMSQQDQVAKIKEALRRINARRRNSSD